MSLINITISHDLPKVENWLQKVQSVISNLQPELIKTTDYLKEFFSTEVFRSEGGVYGQPWQPLAPATVREKMKKYPLAGILRRTGLMQNSFKSMGTTDYMIIYNSQDYFAAHQLGTNRIPQRIVMNLDRDRLNTIAAIVGQSITERLMSVL